MELARRMLVIRLLEKINLDQEMAGRLHIADDSGYRGKGECVTVVTSEG